MIVFITAMMACKSSPSTPPLPPLTCMDGFATGHLIFIKDTAGGEGFCHVGITECVDTASVVFEINPQGNVVRKTLDDFIVEWYYKFDTTYAFPGYSAFFFVDTNYDEQALIDSLQKYMTLPSNSIDEITMISRFFVTSDGVPIFSTTDSTLNMLASSPLLHPFKIE